MNTPLADLMKRATALTRSGDLRAATALLQENLGGLSATPVPADEADVIDIEARIVEVPTEPTPASPFARNTDAGQVLHDAHSAAGLRCTYRLFVPAGAPTGAPLVVMLHGCTQSADDFAAGTRMDDVAGLQGCYVLYPEQSTRMNAQRCWNWFKHSHQARDRGEPALLASLTRRVMAAHGIDASQVFVAGLSAGGAMAAILGETYPDIFAAVGVHSGLPVGVATDLPSALTAMKAGPGPSYRSPNPGRVPTIVFHGDADRTVSLRNGQAVLTATPCVSTHERHIEPPRGSRGATCKRLLDEGGSAMGELWVIQGAGHAWAGGSTAGSYTDPTGPDASAEMLRFFRESRRTRPASTQVG